MDRTPNMEVMATRRRAVLGVLIGVGVLLLCLLLRGTEAFERPELALLDLRTNTFIGTRPPDPRIVLAVVTEEELERASRAFKSPMAWPWEQDLQAYAVNFLRDAGAGALLCDFLFLDLGKSVEEVDPMYEGGTDSVVAMQLEKAEMLGAALASFQRAAVGVWTTAEPSWEREGRLALAADRTIPRADGKKAGPPLDLGVEISVASILRGARYAANVQARGGIDGVIRDIRPVKAAGLRESYNWPILGLAGAALLEDKPIRWEGGRLWIGDREILLDHEEKILINFRGPAFETYPTVSFLDLMLAGIRKAEGAEPTTHDLALAKRMKGKLVVWGAHYVGNFDFVATPVRHAYLGPELHATIADNLLHGDHRRRSPPWVNHVILAVLCLSLGFVGGITRQRALPHLVAFAFLVAVIAGAFLLFRAGWAIDLFTPVVAIVLTSVATTSFRLLTEGRRNKWLETTFQRYLAPDVIDALKQDPSRVALGGKRRELTIFFSDVAGFTSLTERLGSQQIVSLLNHYLTKQSSLLMEERGTIDKFQGDAIMAFFGDPLDMPDHPVRACRAAVACRRALPELEPVWRKLGLEDFEIRIGLNSGVALVGNMGSEERFDYTCMGDAVNLAARLEGANKAFGSKIMIGPDTYKGAADEILAKPLADLVVVGKSEAVPVYELIAMRDDASDTERDHVAAYGRAHAAVKAGDIPSAREALDAAEIANPGDGPCAWLRTLIARVEAGEIQTPWDGRWVLDKK